jgi:outer membrane receptor protein involved in Fe transport
LYDYKDTINKFTTVLGGLANFAYKKGNSKLAFKNIFNRLFEVTNIFREGTNNDNIQYVKASSNETNIKTLFSSQLEGEHILGKNRSKLNWNANFAYTGGEQPDYRISPYTKNLNDLDNKAVPFQVVLRDSYRFFSKLTDFAYGANASYVIPFKWRGQNNSFKAGGSYLYKTREYSARAFRYKPAIQTQFNTSILAIEPKWVFDPSYMSPSGLVLEEITNPSDQYSGKSYTTAGYAMLDNRLSDKFRIVWGLRVENFNYNVTTADFSNPSIIIDRNYIDWLPSVNLTYSLTSKTNLRFSAFRSVSRPDFREVAPFQFYDFSRNAIIKGNADLERSQNTNLDLRFETYPAAGELFSVSLFAKHFDKPIEFVVQSGSVATNLILTYANPNSAINYGAELEFRKKLTFFDNSFLGNLTAFGNFAYIISSIDFENSGIDVFDADRPMQGQSPYIVNAGLQYGSEKSDFTFSALVNRIGHRVAFAGFQGYPDIYENGRTVVDLQVAKKVFKDNGEFKITVGDLLNQKAIFYQNQNDYTKRSYSKSDDNIWNSFRYGTNITLGFSYNF